MSTADFVIFGVVFTLLFIGSAWLVADVYVRYEPALRATFARGWRARLADRILTHLFDHEDVCKVIGGERVLYLRRFYVRHSSPERGGIFVHRICRSDDDRDPHDHPWKFTSIILRGGYWEEEWRVTHGNFATRPWLATKQRYRAGALLKREATWLHRLQLPVGGECWTLVLTGPRVREWGFETDAGWVPQQDYKRRAA